MAKFEPNPEATVLVSYVSEDETKGTVTNGDGDEIQIVTGETLEGSTAAAKAGYEFTGWYKGNDLVTSDESLSPAVAKQRWIGMRTITTRQRPLRRSSPLTRTRRYR